MKLIAILLAAVTVAVAVSAGASARPAVRASDPGNQIIAALNQLVSQLKADRGKCTKMAADIRSWKAKHTHDFARWRAWGKHLSKSQAKAYAHRWASRVGGVFRTMLSSIMTCAANPDVRAALNELNTATKSP